MHALGPRARAWCNHPTLPLIGTPDPVEAQLNIWGCAVQQKDLLEWRESPEEFVGREVEAPDSSRVPAALR